MKVQRSGPIEQHQADSSMSASSDSADDDNSDSEDWLEPLCKTLQWNHHKNPKRFHTSFFDPAEIPTEHYPNLFHRRITEVPHPLPTSQMKLLESLSQWLNEGQKADGTNLNREMFEQALLQVFQKDETTVRFHIFDASVL
jgi:hypothetical protein